MDRAAFHHLFANANRIVDRGLGEAVAGLEADAAPEPAPPPPADAAAFDPATAFDGLDFGALDGVYPGDDAPPPPADPESAAWERADRAALAALLARLPPGPPPLTAPLDDAGLDAWLALYHAGDAPLLDLLTRIRRLE